MGGVIIEEEAYLRDLEWGLKSRSYFQILVKGGGYICKTWILQTIWSSNLQVHICKNVGGQLCKNWRSNLQKFWGSNLNYVGNICKTSEGQICKNSKGQISKILKFKSAMGENVRKWTNLQFWWGGGVFFHSFKNFDEKVPFLKKVAFLAKIENSY